MIKVCVAGISTLIEPSTAASATTEFAGFLDTSARGAYKINSCCGRHDRGAAEVACACCRLSYALMTRNCIHHIVNVHDIRSQSSQFLPANAASIPVAVLLIVFVVLMESSVAYFAVKFRDSQADI